MEPPTLLIVDDDADMRLNLRGCPGTLGPRVSRVLEAADGLTALRLARSGGVDRVISDVALPGMSGSSLCDAIHAAARLRDIPVLLISSEDRGGAEDGADGFLAKPFNASQLLAAVDGLLPGSARAPPEGSPLDTDGGHHETHDTAGAPSKRVAR